MSEMTRPTMTVLIEGSPTVINESDYDPECHKIPTGDTPPAPTAPEMNGTQLRATLVAMGAEVKSNATKAEMKALLDEATKKE